MASGLRNLRKDLRSDEAKKRKNKETPSKFYADENMVENNIALKNNSEQEQETGSPKREIKEEIGVKTIKLKKETMIKFIIVKPFGIINQPGIFTPKILMVETML